MGAYLGHYGNISIHSKYIDTPELMDISNWISVINIYSVI